MLILYFTIIELKNFLNRLLFWKNNTSENDYEIFFEDQEKNVEKPGDIWDIQFDNKTNICENNDAQLLDKQHDSKISKIKKNFEKKFSIKLTSERKQKLAESIIENAHIWRLYRIQLVISCMLATLGLLMNSIPVVIWSMLVSPIMTPIQTFAFAVINWKKHMYINSLKVLFLSILIAIPSSFLICYVIPFSWITEQVLLRTTPTVVDGIVAILSWIIAFIFLSDEKLEASIVWIAIAVSLMPPLAAVWIWLHFFNRSVAQWSFLLFITNLVWILAVGILIFYLFWFRATNKDWKKRTNVTIIMLVIFVSLITVPLWKSMTKIAETQKINNKITQISNNYFNSLNDEIVINELSFRDVSDDTVRIVSKLDVPAEFSFTNLYKDELTKRLAESLWKSVELDLDIVEISSAYIDKTDHTEVALLDAVHEYLQANNIVLVDYKVLNDEYKYFFFNVFTDANIDRYEVLEEADEIAKSFYPSWVKVILQWQDNLEKVETELIEKSQAEIDLEKQFYALFPKWELSVLSLNYLEKVQEESYVDYAEVTLEFKTPYSAYKTRQTISEWKNVIEIYLWMEVSMKVKFEEINLLEI